MERVQFVIESSSEIITELKECGDEDVRISEPYTYHSPADALESPISGSELTHAMQALTVVFATVNAGLALFEKLLGMIHRPGKKQTLTVIVKDKHGKEIIKLTEHTTIDDIKKKLFA